MSQPRMGDAIAELAGQAVPTRSLPVPHASPEWVRQAGLRLRDLWQPTVVLHQQALRHNLHRFARWCADNGVEHAPHGKTSMAPQLWADQLEAGAWGITAATVAQARVMHAHGVPRVLIANEVVDPQGLRWLAEVLAEPEFDVFCLVDSLEAVEIMEAQLGAASRQLPVLVELGVPGLRTGVREQGAALELAQRVVDSPRLRLAGVEGYEGALPQRRDGTAPEDARQWLGGLTDFVAAADARGLFAEVEEILVTAGGSAFPDLAADALRNIPSLSVRTRMIVRSGCYITHDDMFYERNSPLRSSVDPDPLRPAFSCYATVLSCPEPGRALLGVGKRDVAFDIDLPAVRALLRDGQRVEPTGALTIGKLNDHHGFCDVDPGALDVGDVVELALSHPCTIFDKWQLIPVIDDEDRVVDAVRTIF